MRHSSSLYIYKLQLFIRLAPMQQNFQEFAPHLDACPFQLASNLFHFYSVGSDDILFSYDTNNDLSNSLSLYNPDSQQITAFVVHPKHTNSFIYGTSKGFVKYLRPIHHHQLQKSQVLYKGDRSIKYLSLNPSGKLVGIATQDEQTFVYSIRDKRLFSLSQRHEGGSIRVFFGGKDYVCSLGLQGILHLYGVKQSEQADQDSQSEDPFANYSQSLSFSFIDKYRIASESITKKYGFFNAIYAQLHGESSQKIIFASGQTYLQQIELRQKSSTYKIQTRIREQQQILLVQVLTTGTNQSTKTIVTSSLSSLSIWNYTKKERLLSINTAQTLKGCINSIVRVLTQQSPSFAFAINSTQSSSKIYYFKNQSLLSQQIDKSVQQTKIKKVEKQQKYQSRWQPSKSAKLLPDYSQHILQKQYEDYKGARFVFYNNIGCIIERSQESFSSLQLELHDKSRPKRLHMDEKNRPFSMFALREDIFAYATSNLFVFQSQKQMKEGFSSWEFRWEDIQGIAIGGEWVAICSLDQIKILDYSGNELHGICFDRRFITIQAYEDILAVVYHSSPPMWGCQSLKVRLYQITAEKIKLQRDTMLPITPNSRLKWFGFSQQGMLYCHDNLQVLRGYIFERDEWQIVHSLQSSSDRIFIQHISGIDIYGFRIQQKQGQKIEPRVLPRSLPRKIPMELPSFKISFLSKQQEAYLKRVKLRNIQLFHEEFRYGRWYKYKYSRKKTHLWGEYSKSIMSLEEIKTFKAQIDYQLIEYLKKFIKGIEDQNSKEYQFSVRSLMLIIERQAHFQETKEAARKILEIGSKYQKSHLFEDAVVRNTHRRETCLTKLNQINILQRMMNVLQKV